MASKQPGFKLNILGMIVGSALVSICSQSAFSQTTPSSAESVRGGILDASDASRLSRFMTTLGYQADMAHGPAGDPTINGRISATDYSIQFYECENGEFCNSIQFLADTPIPPDMTMEKVNAFNMRWRYVRASVTSNVVRLQMDVNLDGGVTAGNIEDTLDIWRRLLETFETEFAAKAPAR
ncbi:YbjN domain-containing protein [Hirschia litorea]|uniref:YbjN domain-containing protein n=1 Tax=Hirschia litorea TaxID=1199156 RepID=A0ABW2ILF2_9PROT